MNNECKRELSAVIDMPMAIGYGDGFMGVNLSQNPSNCIY